MDSMFKGLREILQRETCTTEWLGRMESYVMMYVL
jgi:hypothetical protein